MKMKKILLLVSLLMLAHINAFAGGAESHGGQVVICPGKEPVMLDYYQATLPTQAEGKPDLVDISKMSSDDVLSLFKSRIENAGQLWGEYDNALEVLGPIDTWLEGNLQFVSDSDPAYTLPQNCTLQQVAVRQDSTMYVDPTVLQQLSPAQQGILRAHEALYYVASQVNGRTSSIEVRMVIRNLLMKNIDIVALSKTVHEMGSNLFWWEDFANGLTYHSEKGDRGAVLQLFYSYLVSGDHLGYSLTLFDSGAPENFTEGGSLVCSDNNFGDCQTKEGSRQCIFANVWSYYSGTNIVHQFELQCTDGTDIHFTTHPELPSYPKPSSCVAAVVEDDAGSQVAINKPNVTLGAEIGTTTQLAEAFLVTSTQTVSEVQLKLDAVTPHGTQLGATVSVQIVPDSLTSATGSSSSLPTMPSNTPVISGSISAMSALSSSLIGELPEFYDFCFPGAIGGNCPTVGSGKTGSGVTLHAGQIYWIVVTTSAPATSTSYVEWRGTNTGAPNEGGYVFLNGQNWIPVNGANASHFNFDFMLGC
jgi:hypothetical protein